MEPLDQHSSKGELTRRRIIAEAAPVFNRQGYAGASMQDIMAATGLEKGGLYRHFSSKEELAVESFRYALAQSVKLRTHDLEHVEGAIAKLRCIVDRFIGTPSAVPGGCPLMNTAIDADDGNPALRRLAREGIEDWKKRIAAIVDRGRRTGEISREAVPRQVANTIVATLEGALMISRIEASRQALQDAAASLNVFLDALAPAARPAKKRAR